MSIGVSRFLSFFLLWIGFLQIDEYFYISDELLTYYWDWEIVRFEETIFDCNSGGVPHRHAMDVMIAKRI